MFDSISSCTVWTVDPFSSHLRFSVVVSGTNRSACTLTMLDSGATAVFINERFVLKHNILRRPLTRPIALHNIDGSINKAGSLTHFARLTMNIGSKYTEKLDFLITDLGPEDIVTVAPYFSLFFVFFSPALIATAPHTWLSHGRHAETTQSLCSAHSASFASRIIGYLVT
jgi:hypothetical protein